jgi:NAD(P)-dependent dehydrogenase (short-subunit alcohol dehydrogenase family)
MELKGKIVLITGASSGIGKAIAENCIDKGASIIVFGRSITKLRDVFKKTDSSKIAFLEIDLSDIDSIFDKISDIENIDAIVHSAGMLELRPLRAVGYDNLRETMKLNFESPVMLTNFLLKKKKINKGGSIVFISSINGNRIGNVGYLSYASSKAALIGAMKVIALELAPKKIRVNSVLPGVIKTEMALKLEESISKEAIDEDIKKYPLKSYGTPEDVANIVNYLISDVSNWVTGSEFVIDGGFTLN